MLDKQRSSSTIKDYAAAIAASHAPIAGRWVGRNSAVLQFLRGAKRINPPCPRTVPLWNLPTVWTIVIHEPLQALSINPACLEFGPNDSKVVLKSRLGYVPKVLSTPFRAQVIALSALSPSTDDQELSLLCPVRALRVYIEHSASYRRSEQLSESASVTVLKVAKFMKTIISRWLVSAITLAYSSLGLQYPIGVRAHSTISEICVVAGWSSPSTFVRFYNLEFPALQARVLSA